MTSKAKLLISLREKQGTPASGTSLAKELGISRVAVWKIVQSLVEAGYSIETGGSGYLLDPAKEKDFLYPWEFGERESLFYHYKNTESTMDRAREAALRGAAGGTIITADKQSAGRGRNGRTWVSRQGGLFFSIIERPRLTVADYSLVMLVMQIAAAKSISLICGRKAYLRWPNDVYINNRKIAGLTAEIAGEGDMITYLTGGIGINVNNNAPSQKAVSCAEITGNQIMRKMVLNTMINEIDSVKKLYNTTAAYSQGNRALCEEWNSMSDCIGAKTAVFEPESKDDNFAEKSGRILARGAFQGIDPAGRCIIKTEEGKLYFNQGSVSLAFLNVSHNV